MRWPKGPAWWWAAAAKASASTHLSLIHIYFPSARSFVNYNGLDSQGRYIYSMGTVEDLRTLQDKGESQWALQLTLRYSF